MPCWSAERLKSIRISGLPCDKQLTYAIPHGFEADRLKMPARYHLGVDIGGTFTDFVLADEHTGELLFHKALTTPEEPAHAVVEGLEILLKRAGVAPVDIVSVIHGTTLASNAIIERKGAATGLLTTRGFRDVLEMGTEQRYDIHDLFLTFPEPLVSRPDRIEVDERMDCDGRP